MRKEVQQGLWILAAIALALSLLAIFIPNLDGPGHRAAANEAAAVSQLRKLNQLQKKYASTHPRSDFACKFADLEALDEPEFKPLFPDENRRAGYAFSLRCPTDPHTYLFLATPLVPEKTGYSAFCTDQQGIIRRDRNPLGKHCIQDGTDIDKS